MSVKKPAVQQSAADVAHRTVRSGGEGAQDKVQSAASSCLHW